VTVNEDGRPTDIRVLRGIPILDEAAIDAVKTWRYAPTAVDGVPRRVKFIEHVDFNLSDRERVRAYASVAQDRQLPSPLRLFAISQLLHVPRKLHKEATEALAASAKDPDPSVASAAKTALEQLATGGR
jgi:TonB family protein